MLCCFISPSFFLLFYMLCQHAIGCVKVPHFNSDFCLFLLFTLPSIFQSYDLFFLIFFLPLHPLHSSQARGWIGAAAAGIHHSHGNTGSLTHWARPGIEPASSWIPARFISAKPQWDLWVLTHAVNFWMGMTSGLGEDFPNISFLNVPGRKRAVGHQLTDVDRGS